MIDFIMKHFDIIVTAICSFLGGGFIGFKFGVYKKISQKQAARDRASQVQIGVSNNG